MTASEYHITEILSNNDCRGGPLSKGLHGSIAIKRNAGEYHNQKKCHGEPQLKELPKNYIPISGSIKNNYERNTKKFVLDVL